MLKTFIICQTYFAMLGLCCFALCRTRGAVIKTVVSAVWAGVMLTASYAVWIEPAAAHRSTFATVGEPNVGVALPLSAIGPGDR